MSPDAFVARFASEQHGLLTLAQAERAGFTPTMIWRRVSAGRWERVHRGVFRLAGAPATYEQRVLAACMISWGRVVASHSTAAALLRLDGFVAGPVELIVPRGLQLASSGARVHQSGPVERRDVTRVGGIPVTSVVRTLIDLSGTCSPALVEQALDDALRRGLVPLVRLRRRLDELARRGRPGVRALRSLLDQRTPSTPITGSVLESRLKRLLARARLPAPVSQYRVTRGPRLVAVVDFAYPRERIALEVEGYAFHSGRLVWQRDRSRARDLARLGWMIVPITFEDLRDDPDGVCASVADALAMRRHSRWPDVS